MKLSNRIAAGAVLITVALASAGWAFKIERNTARTATAIEILLSRLPGIESGVSENRTLGNKNATRLDGVDKRLDDHQRLFETINIQKGDRPQ